MLFKHRVQRLQLREYCYFTLIPLTKYASHLYIFARAAILKMLVVILAWQMATTIMQMHMISVKTYLSNFTWPVMSPYPVVTIIQIVK